MHRQRCSYMPHISTFESHLQSQDTLILIQRQHDFLAVNTAACTATVSRPPRLAQAKHWIAAACAWSHGPSGIQPEDDKVHIFRADRLVCHEALGSRDIQGLTRQGALQEVAQCKQKRQASITSDRLRQCNNFTVIILALDGVSSYHIHPPSIKNISTEVTGNQTMTISSRKALACSMRLTPQ